MKTCPKKIEGWTLITGASSGIGLAMSEHCAASGENLILTGRNADQLESLAAKLRIAYSVDIRIIIRDLAPSGSGESLAAEIIGAGLTVRYLINNAGFGTLSRFTELDHQTESEMMHVNILSLLALIRALLPDMVKSGSGKILNVASTAAFQPGPYMAVYFASKAFVLSFSQALGEELRDSGVTVTVLCPGPVRTGFQKRAGVRDSYYLKFASMEASSVAAAGHSGMLSGRSLVIPGLKNRIGVLIVKYVPRAMVNRFVAFLQFPEKSNASSL